LVPGPFVVALGLSWSASAHAEERARLVYVRGAGAETCPVEVDLRVWVLARLGYDPFSPQASRVVVARIEARSGALHGNVELVDAQGLTSGQRSMSSSPERCPELARAMALSISLAIDPERASQAPPTLPSVPQDSEPPSAAAPPESPPPREAPVAPAKPGGSALAGMAVMATSGALPGLGLGGLGYVGWRASRLAVTLEGRAQQAFFGREVGRSGRLSGSLIGAGVAACGQASSDFSACLAAVAAAQRLSSSAVAVPGASTGLFVGVGPRLLWRKSLGRGYGLSVGLEGLVNLSRNTARFSEVDVWTAPLLCGGGWFGLDTHFL